MSRTFTSPLDVLKIISQVGTPETKGGGVISTTKELFRTQGLRGFWKGNVMACIRLFPYNAIQFAVFHELRSKKENPTFMNALYNNAIVGSISGLTATIITYPLDVIKTRLVVDQAYRPIAYYRGIIDVVKYIYRDEGILAFYKGLLPSAFGISMYSGGLFMAYELILVSLGKPLWEITPKEHFVSGCIAAMFAQTFSFPFDTIRKKMHAQSTSTPAYMKPDIEFSGMMDAFRKTVKRNGFVGLWSGNAANLLKVVPFAGTTFAVYASCKNYFQTIEEPIIVRD